MYSTSAATGRWWDTMHRDMHVHATAGAATTRATSQYVAPGVSLGVYSCRYTPLPANLQVVKIIQAMKLAFYSKEQV